MIDRCLERPASSFPREADQVVGGVTRGWQRDFLQGVLRGGTRAAWEVWAEGAEAGAERALEDLLRPLREKYPPRTPLDEE